MRVATAFDNNEPEPEAYGHHRSRFPTVCPRASRRSRACRPPISRRSRRCSARSSSTTTPTTASPISCEPEHFVEEIHRRIYEIAGSLIRAGKIASPITLKTFLGEHDLGHGLTVQQYLARLALEATTIINAHDYGRSIHDLAVRRELIRIGEDVVNVAYDSPVDSTPARSDRGGGEAALSDRRRRQIRRRLPELFRRAEDGGRHGRPRL